MKRVLKWMGIAVLTPILLFVLLTILLYIPPIQNWAAKKVAAYASEETGMEITVGRVALKFPLDLSVTDFRMIKANDSIPGVRDTIADVGELVVDVQLLPLFKKKVEIDALEFNRLKVNTDGLIPEARVKGRLEHFALESHGIDLKAKTLRVNTAQLKSADVSVELSDTVPPDTTESENFWKIYVDELNIDKTRIAVHTPGDTTSVQAFFDKAAAREGYFDLKKSEYKLQKFDWTNGALKYDNNFEPRTDGLDFNHLELSDVNVGIDSLHYCDPKLDFSLRNCAFKEKSGMQVDDISGPISLENNTLHLPSFSFRTPNSDLKTSLTLDLSTFDPQNPGTMNADVEGYLGKKDLTPFLKDMPKGFVNRLPNHPLRIKGKVGGNMQHLRFDNLRVSLPTAFDMTATGYVENLSEPSRLKADVKLHGKTQDIGFVSELLPADTRKQVRIPNGIGIDGTFNVNGDRYVADFVASQGGGTMKTKAVVDTRAMNYTAEIDAKNMPLQNFLPNMGLSPFTGTVFAKGSGTDFLSPRTKLEARANIKKFTYGGYSLDGMKAKANVQNGKILADIDSHNSMLNGNIQFNGRTNSKMLQGTIVADLKQADLHRLGITDESLLSSVCAHVDVATDLDEYYKVKGTLSDLVFKGKKETYRPDDVQLDVLMNRDTTHAVVESGDFYLNMDGRGGYKRLLSQVERFTDEVQTQLKNKRIDQAMLRQKLPDARIYLSSGRENFFSHWMKGEGYQFDQALIDIKSSHVEGLDGHVNVYGLVADSIRLDTVRVNVQSDKDNFVYNGQVRNNKKNPQYVFNALFSGALSEKGSDIHARLYDANDELGVDIGLAATMEENGMKVHLTDTQPILGYKTFIANADNYIFLSDDKRVSADLMLRAADGQAVQISTNDETDALQDLTVSLSRFDLEKVTSVLPYFPRITGKLDGDYHIIQTSNELSVSSAMSISGMTYEGYPMGNLSTEFVYMPKSDGSHYVDGILLKEGAEVGTITGTYRSEGEGYIDASLGLFRTPLELLNGFVPDQVVGLKGYGEGTLSMKGTLSRPQINGSLNLDSAYLVSVPYGVSLRFAEEPIQIKDSKLQFNNFKMYGYNESPLTMNGELDFSNLDRMMMDVRMTARDFQVINAKENYRSETYGKAFVNFFALLRGPLDALTMRGRVDVLGSTDMTYVLRDSPLTTDNRLEELVTFVDFNDSTQTHVTRPTLSGFNMDLTVNIDEGAHIKCDLNSDHTNYIDLIGGGELRMQSNAIEPLRLTGRYTLANGEMKYSLPIIPLKTFTIKDGSYIEFRGDAMNPTLNITATERTKASVGDSDGSGRTVEFECGVIVTKTLNDMGLEFIIDAPEDMAVSNELNTMSKEERGKLAVTMLTTGMYLADGNTSGITMNTALSSFLQNEINHITGSALRTLDLSFGVDNTTDAAGRIRTDYSFKFAKRFWNNRLRIVIGGKVSSGTDMYNQNESFFDNVTFEYRLDQKSNKYLKLFYDRNSYDWIEGEVGRYGAGFIWRRKLQHFKDIFKFKSDIPQMPLTPMRSNIQTDSLQTDSVRRQE